MSLDHDEDLNTPEMKRLLRTLGARPSKSAEESRAQELSLIEAMTVPERMAMALRLGRRDRGLARGLPRGGHGT
ncbi:MAG: hypothetical protein EOO70_04465 [Myxococcaceae bacterium]|nr:MAG: hypothetical protein EOO70_04465 [Myxococcaceae bacterium]